MRNPWLEKAEKKKAAEAVEYYEENYIGFYTNRSGSFTWQHEDLVEEAYVIDMSPLNRPFFYVS